MPKLIFHLRDDNTERPVELVPGEPVTLGRNDANTVHVIEPTLSRHHARLTWREDDDTWLVEDLQSANGTTLNDAPLTAPEPLRDGDRLCFGEVSAVFFADDADVAGLPGNPTPRGGDVRQPLPAG